jgi:hypothetical protein
MDKIKLNNIIDKYTKSGKNDNRIITEENNRIFVIFENSSLDYCSLEIYNLQIMEVEYVIFLDDVESNYWELNNIEKLDFLLEWYFGYSDEFQKMDI